MFICLYLFICLFSLQSDLISLINTAPHKHLLVLDTNIAIHQIDVLEYKCPSTSYVVILQTVLQEVQHLNIAIYRRICALLQDETKSYIFFPNEQVSSLILHVLFIDLLTSEMID